MDLNGIQPPTTVILSNPKDPSRRREFVLSLGSFVALRMTVAGDGMCFASLRDPSWFNLP
jgi:hypothetical protein